MPSLRSQISWRNTLARPGDKGTVLTVLRIRWGIGYGGVPSQCSGVLRNGTERVQAQRDTVLTPLPPKMCRSRAVGGPWRGGGVRSAIGQRHTLITRLRFSERAPLVLGNVPYLRSRPLPRGRPECPCYLSRQRRHQATMRRRPVGVTRDSVGFEARAKMLVM